MSDKNWAFPKFFLMREFERSIKWLGCAHWASTGFGERSHTDLKPHAAFTNNHKTDRDHQASLLPLSLHCCQRLQL